MSADMIRVDDSEMEEQGRVQAQAGATHATIAATSQDAGSSRDCKDTESESSSDDDPDNVMAYVKKYPFPSYAEIERAIESYVHRHGGPLLLIGDYGPVTHDECAKMYANGFTDRNIAYEAGTAIALQGGFTAMQAAYQVMRDFTPLSHAHSHDVRTSPVIVKYHWDGIKTAEGITWKV